MNALACCVLIALMGCGARTDATPVSTCRAGVFSEIVPSIPAMCKADGMSCGTACTEVWAAVVDCAKSCARRVFVGCRDASSPRLLLTQCFISTSTGETYSTAFVTGIPAPDLRACTEEEDEAASRVSLCK